MHPLQAASAQALDTSNTSGLAMGQGWGGIEHEGTSFIASPHWKMGFGQAGSNFSGSQRQNQASSSLSFATAQWVLGRMGALPSARP